MDNEYDADNDLCHAIAMAMVERDAIQEAQEEEAQENEQEGLVLVEEAEEEAHEEAQVSHAKKRRCIEVSSDEDEDGESELDDEEEDGEVSSHKPKPHDEPNLKP